MSTTWDFQPNARMGRSVGTADVGQTLRVTTQDVDSM